MPKISSAHRLQVSVKLLRHFCSGSFIKLLRAWCTLSGGFNATPWTALMMSEGKSVKKAVLAFTPSNVFSQLSACTNQLSRSLVLLVASPSKSLSLIEVTP